MKVTEIEISYTPSISTNPIIRSSMDAYNELIKFYEPSTIALQEKFTAMYLNNANRVLGVYELSKGGITGTLVDIRLLLSVALKVAATGIILCHNHPSGNLNPSVNDIEITKRIKEAAKILEIKLLDHLIISVEGHLSLMEEGMI